MSFVLAASAASAVGAKRAPVAGARLGKSAHIPRRAMHSSVTRAAVGADEGAAIKPFEVRTPRRIPRALVKCRHAAPPPALIAGASNGDAFVPGGSCHPKLPWQLPFPPSRATNISAVGIRTPGVFFGFSGSRTTNAFFGADARRNATSSSATRRSRERTRADRPTVNSPFLSRSIRSIPRFSSSFP